VQISPMHSRPALQLPPQRARKWDSLPVRGVSFVAPPHAAMTSTRPTLESTLLESTSLERAAQRDSRPLRSFVFMLFLV
jgi:hypothetical protein